MPQHAKKSRPSLLWRIVLIVAVVVFVISGGILGFMLYQYWYQDKAYEDLEVYADINTLDLSEMSVDWDALRAINPDIVGWIYIPDTPINYPIVQGADNDEYLHKAFDSTEGWLASAGTIFLDELDKPDFLDRNNVLYGHHMNDGSMFASVADWEDNEQFNQHRDIYILSPEGNFHLISFALVKTVGSDQIVTTTFPTDSAYESYIQDKLNRSVVTQEGKVITAGDVKQSFMFSTCEYSQNDGRSILVASVVETTVANDPWVSYSQKSQTSLTEDRRSEIGEAA